MLSILRSTGTRLTHSFYSDGVLVDADSTVTVGITKADGSALVASGTATGHPSTGTYTYDLAPQANLNILTVTWTGTFSTLVQSQADTVEIVGGFYLSLAEMRTIPGLEMSPSNDVLTAKRRAFEQLVERYCGVQFVRRYYRETIPGRWTQQSQLTKRPARVLLSAKTTDTNGTVTTYTTTNWGFTTGNTLVTDGDILAGSLYGADNLTFEYEYGYDYPDADLVEASKIWIGYELLKDRSQTGRNYSARTTPEGYTETPIIPDWDAGRPTGLVDVDNVLNAIGRRTPAIA